MDPNGSGGWTGGSSGRPIVRRRPYTPGRGPGGNLRPYAMTIKLCEILNQRDPVTNKKNLETIIWGLVRAARDGHVPAINLIFDRLEGRMPEAVSHEQSGEVILRVVRDLPALAAPNGNAMHNEADPEPGHR